VWVLCYLLPFPIYFLPTFFVFFKETWLTANDWNTLFHTDRRRRLLCNGDPARHVASRHWLGGAGPTFFVPFRFFLFLFFFFFLLAICTPVCLLFAPHLNLIF
jgi:hypothetical protein